MRRFLLFSAVGLWLAQLGVAGARDVKPTPPTKPAEPAATCGNHGTSIDFLESPSEAAAKAKKEEKLVLVLHVSGNFEDPRFT